MPARRQNQGPGGTLRLGTKALNQFPYQFTQPPDYRSPGLAMLQRLCPHIHHEAETTLERSIDGNWWPLFAWPRAARGISASQSVALKVGTVTSGTDTGTGNGTVNSTGTDIGTFTDNGVVACLVPTGILLIKVLPKRLVLVLYQIFGNLL